MRTLLVALLLMAAAAGTPVSAAGTGYVFVSHERSHTVAVLDPARDHAVSKGRS